MRLRRCDWHRSILDVLVMLCVAACVQMRPAALFATPLGWRLVWSDDFDTLDEQAWQATTGTRPTDNVRHANLAEQVSVSDGKLVILAENEPAEGLPYRSGELRSKRAQRHGRWEIRARIPTTRGLKSSIRLVPASAASSSSSNQYVIDIMANSGERPTITASACHWGATPSSPAGRIVLEQQTSLAGRLVSYHDDFHTYALEWVEDQLRFYVDDVYHGVLYSDEVGGFFSRQKDPMRLAIGVAVGGDSVPPPDDTTIWPQRMLVDWVRVYQAADKPAVHTVRNGGFEENGGTLAGWHVFASRTNGDPNVLAAREAVKEGSASLKLSGQASGGESYSGVSQGISLSGRRRVRAKLAVFVDSDSSLSGTGNQAFMKIEFYNNWGDYFSGPAMLAFKEILIADRSTPVDAWKEHELLADVPDGAIEARLSLVFAQRANERGAIHVDAVHVEPIE